MQWGQRWGLPWGLIEKYLRSTVSVRLVRGTYLPCRNCRWYGECVVPKRDHLRGLKSQRRRLARARKSIYVCEDYVEKSQKAQY